MVIQILALTFPGWLHEALPQTEFKYLYEFQRALAILVFGLSGLRTGKWLKKEMENKMDAVITEKIQKLIAERFQLDTDHKAMVANNRQVNQQFQRGLSRTRPASHS